MALSNYSYVVATMLVVMLMSSSPITAQEEETTTPTPVAEATSIPLWADPTATTIKVCTSEYTPMVYCTDREPAAYSGYEIELFRKVQRILGWTDDQLEWSCLGWEEMQEGLRDGTCDMAVAGLEIVPELVEEGFVFTRPTYRNGLTVMVKNTQKTNGTWAFWDAFEWQVWVAAILTALAVSIIVWGIDNYYFPAATRHGDTDPLAIPDSLEAKAAAQLDRDLRFDRYYWESLTRPMMPRDMWALTFAGNVIYFAWGFALLILYTLYLGNTAANLTILRLETGGIEGVETLPGKAAGTWTDYTARLQEGYGVAAVGYPWDTVEDEAAMFEALQTGTIKGLVLDSPLLEYTAATDCSLSIVGDRFDEFDVGTAFAVGFNNSALLDKYNSVLVSLGEDGEIEDLEATYVTPPESECGELYSAKVTLEQVAGLWIILGICIAVAVLWAVVIRVLNKQYTGHGQSNIVETLNGELKGAAQGSPIVKAES